MSATTSPIVTKHPVAGDRVRFHRWVSILYLQSAGATLLAALPLGLLWANGLLQVLGIAYATVWVALTIPGMGAYVWLLFDAALMVLNRPAIFLPGLIARVYRGEPRMGRRSLRRIQAYAKIAVWVNPLSNLVLASFLFVGRMRPELLNETFQRAEKLRKQWEQIPPVPEAASEVSRPVVQWVEEFERELVVC